MAIALQPLATLDPTVVAQTQAVTTAQVNELSPGIDTRRGPIADLVLYLHSLLATQLGLNVQDYLNARSLAQIEINPNLSDPALVADVVSNFGLTPQTGTVASGEVTIIVSSPTTVTLAVGSVFVSKGLNFHTTQVWTAKAQQSQLVSPGDVLLVSLNNGNYAFTINVTADAVGSEYLIPANVLVVPQVLPSNYVSSYAASSFTGGTDAETNAELISRLQAGIAAKTVGGRVNYAAYLRQIQAFANIVAQNVIGMGDPEMLRDRHWIWPISGGGRVDWYIRSQGPLQHVGLIKQAVCVSIDPITASSNWQFSVNRDEAPGFYEFRNIRLASSQNTIGGFVVVSDQRTLNLQGDGFVPDIATIAEGDYTRFMTTVITFTDTTTSIVDLTIGTVQSYNVDVINVPLIDSIQDTLLTADNRSRVSDILAKNAVPVFLQVNFTIVKPATSADPDLTGIANALAASVNAVGFVGTLYASQLQSVISTFLTTGMHSGRLDMFGRLRYPGGRTLYLRNPDVLTVPTDPANLVSSRTVQFFLDPADVGITVVAATPSNL